MYFIYICCSIYTYSKDNWSEKASKYFWNKEFKSKYTSHGVKYENIAREKYITEENKHVEECGLIVCISEPWLGYSPDGIVVKNGRPVKLLEIKCPYDLQSTEQEELVKKCKFLRLEKGKMILKKKHAYYAQIQFGMA